MVALLPGTSSEEEGASSAVAQRHVEEGDVERCSQKQTVRHVLLWH